MKTGCLGMGCCLDSWCDLVEVSGLDLAWLLYALQKLPQKRMFFNNLSCRVPIYRMRHRLSLVQPIVFPFNADKSEMSLLLGSLVQSIQNIKKKEKFICIVPSQPYLGGREGEAAG